MEVGVGLHSAVEFGDIGSVGFDDVRDVLDHLFDLIDIVGRVSSLVLLIRLLDSSSCGVPPGRVLVIALYPELLALKQVLPDQLEPILSLISDWEQILSGPLLYRKRHSRGIW